MILASYNVHSWVGRDVRSDPLRVGEVIVELGADVIGLQEVLVEDRTFEPLASLGRELERHVAFAPTFRRRGHLFGNAVLSRWPFHGLRRLELGGLEPRCALAVAVRSGDQALWVVGTHLGLSVRERRRQAERLLAWLRPFDLHRVVLAGDFNAWLPWTDADLVLARAFGHCIAPRSFPAWRPLFRLDRVFARPSLLTGPVCIHETTLSRVASDHLPVVASLAVRVDEASLPPDPKDTSGPVVVVHRHG